VTTKTNGPTFDRPDGSAEGLIALSDSINGQQWHSPVESDGASYITGQINMVRSAFGPSIAGTTLAFVPFARDAVSYVYFDHNTGHLSTLTTPQLNALYSSPTGKLVVGSDTVEACLMTSRADNRSLWESAIGVTDQAATAAVAASGCGSNYEDDYGNQFITYASGLPTGTDAVIPFSVADWVAQANGVSIDLSATARGQGANLGAIDGLGPSYSGVAPNEAPNAALLSTTTYGHDDYIVLPSYLLVSGRGRDTRLQSLFAGLGSSICAPAGQATITSYGFGTTLPAGQSCGMTTITGNG